ncbi:Cell division cycle protein 20 [Thelohanellus kitauei]|uniref:Cell division cycle protein 20 n=1 Tax=Thelohanellus kitauei TaxID=669202 RepID=A0A0C2JWX0_THEKT|nr:Cell division cycle protein 20 [Thelohanellus kitauei]
MIPPTTSDLKNDSKNKRIHLSPLANCRQTQLPSVKIRDSRNLTSENHNRRKSRSFSNLSEIDKTVPESGSLSQNNLFYDDRYIPRPFRDVSEARDTINGQREESQKLIAKRCENHDEEVHATYQKIRECVSEQNIDEDRILSFSRVLPQSYEASATNAVTFIRASATKPKWKLKRYVPTMPERVLDAPDLVNDYYLNNIHWGGDNHLSIGLGSCVFILNATTGKISKIGPLQDENDYVSSVQWSGYSSATCLAVGYSSGHVKLYDVSTSRCLRTLFNTSDRIPSMSWNENILTCGSRRGVIVNFDVRIQHAMISSLSSHTQEVCGLAWSANGSHLASGGNDNDVYVWDKAGACSNAPVLHHFVSHRAAVKAIAWHPRQHNILVSGGGMSDHTLNFWNVSNGFHLSSLPTNSQISGVVWNPRSDEFVTSHGHPQNQLTLWTYPTMEIGANLISHTDRILSIALSPDATTVASIGADETLRLWKCFEPPTKPSRSDDVSRKPHLLFN